MRPIVMRARCGSDRTGRPSIFAGAAGTAGSSRVALPRHDAPVPFARARHRLCLRQALSPPAPRLPLQQAAEGRLGARRGASGRSDTSVAFVTSIARGTPSSTFTAAADFVSAARCAAALTSTRPKEDDTVGRPSTVLAGRPVGGDSADRGRLTPPTGTSLCRRGRGPQPFGHVHPSRCVAGR